jgi:dTMP kinase
MQLLADYLQGRGYRVVVTREPGGTPIGDEIRAILLDTKHDEMTAPAEILLFSASRAQHVAQVIRPSLARGDIVLCDRYAESTLAYQGYGRGLNLQILRTITNFAIGGLRPDLIVLLDIDVEEGLRRKLAAQQVGQSHLDRLDQEDLAFHRRVRDGYLQMAAAEPGRWLVVDATRSVEEIQRSIQAKADALLARRIP